ncbi:RIP metalloprotease RseP [Orbus wheelerorum]|uniref:RIP metalloprotease RseP n=1 Tax=Orbus wheelerorum TaxID=3074111 RepID=UPI00370D618D
MIWSTIIFLITISILVTVHEFGHFIIARFCGVKVECFSVGFGKKIWSHTSTKGTEYTLSAIPLGGYVKMLDGRNQPLNEEQKKFAFNHKSIIKRTAIISAGPIANFILAIIVYWVIFQIGIMTYPVKIAGTVINTPASIVNIPQGAELKSIAGIKIESWADVNSALIGEMGNSDLVLSYTINSDKLYKKIVNIKNWQFDIEKESPITAFGLIPAPVAIYPIISAIVDNSAAVAAGLEVNDEIIRYNNQDYDNWNNFSQLIKKGDLITLTIKRKNEIFTLNLQPKLSVNEKGETVGIAGIYPSNNTIVKQYDIVGAFVKGFEQTGLTIKQVTRSFYQLVTGVISIKNLSGPISIAKGAGKTASYGIVPYLFFLAFISISLGVINLVPLPMLDGGHLLFLLIEKIKGSPVSNKVQEVFYRVGFILLMIIMGTALFNDFVRL